MLDYEFNQNEVKMMKRGNESLVSAGYDGVSSSLAMPETPKDGIVVKVAYLGACYSEGLRRRGAKPSFPGNEIGGYIHDISNTVPNCNFTRGDKVILFPTEDIIDQGYVEYIAVEDTTHVIQVPEDMPLEVATMLPGSALTAYSAVLKAKPHVEKLQQVKPCVNVLIVGAGGLGLWCLQLAQYLIKSFGQNNVRIFMADNSIDKLLVASEHGCYDIIHWNEEDHEQYIVERTLDACRGGVDVIIDLVSSPRTNQRSLKVLNRNGCILQEGLILVGGDSMSNSNVSISLNSLSAKQQSLVGIPKGNLNQLYDLLHAVQENKITPPSYAVFPVEDANQVYEDIQDCRITGRAIFRFVNSSSTMDNSPTTTY
ncbi:hypothetical protein LOTGIDRAFT_208046 [Lottia gigantea]|uniref:Enoyl reductase (ER) domain-containing protein n=1 Tax=Lottia gigantea TaxID=225164 RepID=V4CRH3_LOTGI|nr:hypothetical protein LOTGIDRAFT_208046 [Lottia gigantea]ESP05105.1 hypothetical protein LOTGIDRAFT_208046 [Lottia gigantea]